MVHKNKHFLLKNIHSFSNISAKINLTNHALLADLVEFIVKKFNFPLGKFLGMCFTLFFCCCVSPPLRCLLSENNGNNSPVPEIPTAPALEC